MNNRITVILIIGLLVGIGGIVYISIAEPFQKALRACALWVGKPKVVYEIKSNGGWFLKGHDKGPVDYAYKKVTSRLVEVLKAHSSWRIDENYCNRYVNPYNNTIVIVSKSLDDKVKQAFLDVMKPPEKVTVLFRKGPASSFELDEWINVIRKEWDILREKGVLCQSYGKTENGTLRIGVYKLNKEKVRIILTVLRGKVPPGILVIENESRIVLH